MRSPRSAMLKLQIFAQISHLPCCKYHPQNYAFIYYNLHSTSCTSSSFSLIFFLGFGVKIWFRYVFLKKFSKFYFHAVFETYTQNLLLVHWATVWTRIKDPLTNKLVLIHAYYCQKCSNKIFKKKLWSAKFVIKLSIIILA